MKVTVKEPGKYAGPNATYDQFETKEDGEVVDIDPAFADMLVANGRAEHLKQDRPPKQDKKKAEHK